MHSFFTPCRKFTKPFKILAKAFQDFSFSDAISKKKAQHDAFGDDEPLADYMDVDESLQTENAAAAGATDILEDTSSDSASLAPSADEIEDGQASVINDWTEVTVELPSSSPPAARTSSPAPSSAPNKAPAANAKARRQQKKYAKQKGKRSVRRQHEKEEQKKVSTALPSETTPLSSDNHLAPHKLRSSVSKAHLKPIIVSAPTPNLQTHSTQPAYICKRLKRSDDTPPVLEKLKGDGFKVVPILNEYIFYPYLIFVF